MKNFLLKIILIFSIISFLVFVIVDSSKRKLLSKDVQEKIDLIGRNHYPILIGGDSRGESGVDPSLFIDEAFNISAPGSGITSFKKALEIIEVNSIKAKTLIFTLGLSSLNDGRLLSNHYSLVDDFFEIPFLSLNFYVRNQVLFFWNRIFSCLFNLRCDSDSKRLNKIKKNGFYPFYKTIKEEEQTKEVYQNFFLPFHQNLKVDGLLWRVFQEKLQEIAMKYDRVILIFPPFSKFLFKQIDKKGFSKFNVQVKKEAKKYKNVSFFNFNLMEEFSYKNEFFSDMVHLNDKGAKYFTKQFIKYTNHYFKKKVF